LIARKRVYEPLRDEIAQLVTEMTGEMFRSQFAFESPPEC